MLKHRLIGLAVVLLWAGTSFAQMFQTEEMPRVSDKPVVLTEPMPKSEEEPNVGNEVSENETIDQITKAFAATQQDASATDDEDSPLNLISQALNPVEQKAADIEAEPEEEDIFIPEDELYRLDTPTKDGSKRGGQAFVEVDDEGRMKKSDKIFLFYDNFKIMSRMSKTAGCDVRFNILSNLDRKINQLDIKLVWPGLTTTLSFSNVSPNTQTYYNYSLIGEGCYNMSKAPNIIVNRCRVKGMTSSECANRLVWLMK